MKVQTTTSNNIKTVVLALFVSLLSCNITLTTALRTYYVPIADQCWRIRLTPDASLVGYPNDPACLYTPPDSTATPPQGYKPQPQRIADMDSYESGDTYHFTPTEVFPQRAWSGIVTVVEDDQYPPYGTLLTSTLDYSNNEFTVTIGIPPLFVPVGVDVAIKTAHRSYLRAGLERFGYIINQSRSIQGWEKFRFIAVPDGDGGYRYAIKTHLGTYITALDGGTNAEVTQSHIIDDNSTFIITKTDDGKLMIETLHGTCLRVIAGRIDQTTDTSDPTTIFEIIEL